MNQKPRNQKLNVNDAHALYDAPSLCDGLYACRCHGGGGNDRTRHNGVRGCNLFEAAAIVPDGEGKDMGYGLRYNWKTWLLKKAAAAVLIF